MGIIYKICNDVNDKVYIGQTAFSLEKRYKQHIAEAQKHTQRKLYLAMNTIGVNHFFIQEIEQCEENNLDDREKYWINYYNSYSNGYNMTIGGNGGSIYQIDNDKVQTLWNEGYSLSYIANIFQCSVDAISQRLRNNPNYSEQEAIGRASRKPVYGYDLLGMRLFSFPSAAEAERYFLNAGKDNIAACCRGNTKTAYGYVWSYNKMKFGPNCYKEPRMSFPVVQLTKTGEYIETYETLSKANEAMLKLGYRHPHIMEVCHRQPKYKTSCGFIWRSIYDNEFIKPCSEELQQLINLLDD